MGISFILSGSDFFVVVGVIFCSIVGIVLIYAMIIGAIENKKELAEKQRVQQEEERKKQLEAEEALKKAKIEEEKKAEQLKLYASGNWVVPTDKFYEKCKKEKIENLDDDFYIKKASLVIDKLLKSEGVPQKYNNKYNSIEKMKTYFSEGKKIVEERLQQEYMTPKKVELSQDEKIEQKFLTSLRYEKGTGKREKMLSKIIENLESEIEALDKAAVAMREIGNAIRLSPAQQSKIDWATLGGIASGIAGTAAGLAIAQQAIEQNKKIDEQNSKNREYARNMWKKFNDDALETSVKSSYLKDELALYKKKMEKLHNIVIMDNISQKELFQSLEIKGKVSKNKVLVNITNNYIPQVPPNVKMVIDGTITAKITCDGVLVDRVVIPLPLDGIDCNSGIAECNNYISKKMVGTRKYIIEFKANNLWVMEK